MINQEFRYDRPIFFWPFLTLFMSIHEKTKSKIEVTTVDTIKCNYHAQHCQDSAK